MKNRFIALNVASCVLPRLFFVLLMSLTSWAHAATPQTITGFAPTTPITYTTGRTFTLSATGGASDNPVVFASTTATICTVSSKTVTVLKVGTCTLTANQAGNATYSAAAQVSKNVVISIGSQTITFGAITNKALGTPLTLTGITATSGLTVAMTSATTTICTISGFAVTLVAQGTCTLRANQAGNTNFSAAPQVSQSFTVLAAPVKTNQTITFAAIANTTLGTSLTLTGITATSGLPVTMTSATTTICTVSGFTVTLVATGTCTLRANQAGNASFNAAPQVSQSFTVLAAPVKTNQTITFGAIANTALGTSLTLTGITATSGLTVAMTSATTTICTVSGFAVTLVAQGTCTLRANQAGNVSFNAAPQVSQSFTVLAAPNNKLDQTISFGDSTAGLPSQSLSTSPLKFNLAASSGLTPVLTSGTPDACTVSPSGFNVTLLTTGLCILDANQAGNANYNPAPRTQQRFSVLPLNTPAQTLSYGALQVAAGSLESCAITEFGGVKCWRDNLQAVDIAGLSSGVVALAVGYQSCALMTNGGVKCWGSTRIPVDVVGLTSGVAAIAVGGGHACALTTSGGVKCWGNNASGQLGNNSTIQSNTPVDLNWQ
jgi:Regulator of chromosome condensation (RCC1) repeat